MSFIVKTLDPSSDTEPGEAVIDPQSRRSLDLDIGDHVRVRRGDSMVTVRLIEREEDEFEDTDRGVIRLSGWARSTLGVSENELVALDAELSDSGEVNYTDIGGLDDELSDIRQMVEWPLRFPELFRHVGTDAPSGALLYGPPGTGKTLIARAVANEVGAEFYTIEGPELFSKYVGESEEQLRDVFEEAEDNAPAIILIDELDAMATKRGEGGNSGVSDRIVTQLQTLMDGLDDRGDVMVIATTNRVDAIEPALRRGGRFDRELEIGVPDEDGRREILEIHSRSLRLSDSVDLDDIAQRTHGYVGADLASVVQEAAMTALDRADEELDIVDEDVDEDTLLDLQKLNAIHVNASDFEAALTAVSPSGLREHAVEIPEVTWDDVGGLQDTKDRLHKVVEWPLLYPDVLDEMDLTGGNGVLLYGPPGTGKTLLARAVANESDSNFISVKGPELMDKYVGESEKAVRELFEKARENAPTVVFFDEIESIAGERGESTGESGVGDRVVSQLLTELDGLDNSGVDDVVVIAATNRPDIVDPALTRPGRLNNHVLVPPPDHEGRVAILDVHTEDRPLADDVDLDALAADLDGYVGADLEAFVREAAMFATDEVIADLPPDRERDGTPDIVIEQRHFERAIEESTPSMSKETLEQYMQYGERFDDQTDDPGEYDPADDPTFQ
jgi:transitional endoplasmic reticulum ATPase